MPPIAVLHACVRRCPSSACKGRRALPGARRRTRPRIPHALHPQRSHRNCSSPHSTRSKKPRRALRPQTRCFSAFVAVSAVSSSRRFICRYRSAKICSSRSSGARRPRDLLERAACVRQSASTNSSDRAPPSPPRRIGRAPVPRARVRRRDVAHVGHRRPVAQWIDVERERDPAAQVVNACAGPSPIPPPRTDRPRCAADRSCLNVKHLLL